MDATDCLIPLHNNGEEKCWIPEKEDELLRTLREDLSGQNIEAAAQGISAPAKKGTVARTRKEIIVSEKPAVRESSVVNSEAGISAEDLLALLRDRGKALRGDTPCDQSYQIAALRRILR